MELPEEFVITSLSTLSAYLHCKLCKSPILGISTIQAPHDGELQMICGMGSCWPA